MDHKDTSDILKILGKEITRRRVLLADANLGVLQSMRAMLSIVGITQIQNANSSTDLLRKVQSDQFDIIITDYQLEDGRDGQQILEELRGRRLISLKTIYVLATAERAHQNVISMAELTPDAYLLKPFTPDNLHSRLVQALHKKSIFNMVLESLDAHLYSDALEACNLILAKKTPYHLAAFRYKGQILNSLGRHSEAKAIFEEILKVSPMPYAKMGLAIALRGMGKKSDAEAIAQELVNENKVYLEAHDFLANLREEMGQLPAAQQVLLRASAVSPKNSFRHEAIADIAMRNNDMETAEKSYARILEARRYSALRSVDDYTNLARVLLNRGRVDAARKVAQELQKEWKNSKQAELASIIMETLCYTREDDKSKAKKYFDLAVELREQMALEGEPDPSQKITVDFAHACMATGNHDIADEIFSRVAAENHENRSVIAQIQGVFSSEGKTQEGQSLLARVSREIIEMNNSGVLAAKSGNIEDSVNILIATAERVPNLQFLVNASKAIFTLIDKKGWDEDLADRGLAYLRLAYQKDSHSSKVISACDLYQRVTRRLGYEIQPVEESMSFSF